MSAKLQPATEPVPTRQGKYAKYFVHPPEGDQYVFEAGMTKKAEVQVVSYNEHPEAPYYFEAYLFQAGDEYSVAIGDELHYPENTWIGKQQRRTGLRYFLYPHVHPFQEVYHFMSIDPNDTAHLGGTMDVWVGEGEDAEKFSISKPSILALPEGVRHAPLVLKDMKRSSYSCWWLRARPILEPQTGRSGRIINTRRVLSELSATGRRSGRPGP
jgi:hypothetical protein